MSHTKYQRDLDQFLDIDLVARAAREAAYFDELSGSQSRSLVIYGAGNLGKMTIAGLRKLGIVPLAVADGNATLWSTSLDGVDILGPDVAAKRFGASAVFVIAVWSPGAERRIAVIRSRLEGLGCKKVLSFAPLFRQFPNLFLPHCRIDTLRNALAAADEIRKAFSLMADDESRREYLDQLFWMLSDDFGELTQRWFHETYFPPELVAANPDEVFLDCGAFDGDTIKAFLKVRAGHFRRIIALEPDPANNGKLRDYVSGLPGDVRGRITIETRAIGAVRETLRFEAMGSVSSRLSSTGTINVECVPLIDVVRDSTPTYVKMDIEGAEIGALTGGAAIIRANPPVLAICVYHRQSDLWRIPLLIYSLFDGYRFYMRRYVDEFGDVVCYAVPPSRLVNVDAVA